MNRRMSIWIAVLGIGCFGSLTQAQSAGPANLSTLHNVESLSGTDTKQMDEFIGAKLAVVVNGAPSDQKAALKILIDQAPSTNTSGFSTQYLEAYAASLDKQAQIVLKAKPAPAPLARMRVGVVTATVAEHTRSFQLGGAASILLNDDLEVVALWGMKTAKFVLPGVLNLGASGKEPLLKQMVATGIKFPGPVLTEAYEGLTLEPVGIASAKNAGSQISAVIPSVQALLAARVSAWGQTVPKQVTDDAIGTGFLVFSTVWKLQSPSQQQMTVQLMQALLSKASIAFGTEPDKTSLTFLLNRLGSGFSVVAQSITPTPDATVEAAALPVKKINKGMNPAQAAVACDDLNNAINQMAMMQGAPPLAPSSGPATRPASSASLSVPLAVTK